MSFEKQEASSAGGQTNFAADSINVKSSLIKGVQRRAFRGVSQLAIVSALSAMAICPAFGQDDSVETEETEAIITAERLGPDPATLTVTDTGSVVLSDGTIITVNGPHSLVINGSLSTQSLSDAGGILVDTSDLRLSGDILITAAIGVNGTTTGDNASLIDDRTNLFGIRYTGSQGYEGNLSLDVGADINVRGVNSLGVSFETAFTGDFTTVAGTVIEVAGDNSIGVQVRELFTGNINLGGTLNVGQGTNSQRGGDNLVGVLLDEAVDGRVTLTGSLVVGTASTDIEGNTLDSADGGIIVRRSISGGLLLQGQGENNSDDDLDGDGTPDIITNSQISVIGEGAAIRIENTATNGSDLRLGAVDGLEFGFVSRGLLIHNGSIPDIDSTAIHLGGANSGRVTVDGGLLFDNSNNVAQAVDSVSRVVLLDNNVEIDVIQVSDNARLNAASVTSVNEVDGELIEGPGGNAITIDITPNASLPLIVNGGEISANVNGQAVVSTVIRDRSNTLAQVLNDGEIIANATGSVSSRGIAIDVSTNTIDFSVVSNGDIVGDILFGSGASSLSVTSGSFDGRIVTQGSITDLVFDDAVVVGGIEGGGVINFTATDTQIGLAVGGDFNVTNASFLGASSILAQVDLNSSDAGRLTVSNALTVGGELSVDVVLTDFIVAEQDFIIVDAGSFTGFDQTDLSISSSPFLFESSLDFQTIDGREQIVLSVVPRAADELGLTGSLEDFYGYIQTDLDPSAATATALANAATQEEAFSAIAQLAPDFSNRLIEGALLNQRILGRNFSERLDDYLRGEKNPTGAWAVEHAAIGDIDTSIDALDGDYLNFGLSVGYTGRVSQNLAVGVGAGFSLFGSETQSDAGADVSVFAPYLTAYAITNFGGFYAGLSGSATYLDISRDRNLNFVSGAPLIQAESTGWQFNGLLEAGYAFNIGGFKLKPYGQLSYNSVSEGSYSEIGGSETLVVDSRSVNVADAGGGLSASYDFVFKKTRDFTSYIRPEIYAGADRRLGGSGSGIVDVRFQNSDQSLELTGDRISRNGEFAGAALSWFNAGSVARIRYQYEKRGLVRSHSATLNFKLEF